jgi:ATP-binding cassette, subfamily B, bacterial
VPVATGSNLFRALPHEIGPGWGGGQPENQRSGWTGGAAAGVVSRYHGSVAARAALGAGGGRGTVAGSERRSSRGRFARFREEWRVARSAATDPSRAWNRQGKPDGEPVTRTRSLGRLYSELVGLLRGRWGAVATALGLLSLATLLRLLPPAATKLVIDYVLMNRPLPPRVPTWLPIPSRPEDRLVLLVAAVTVVATVGTVVGLSGRWIATRTSKRLQVRVRRKVFEHAARLPLHRIYQLKAGGAASLLREDADGVGELVFSMVYNPWRAMVQLVTGVAVLAWVDWRFLLSTVVLAPVVFWSDRVWNRRIRTIFRAIRRQRQDLDAGTAEAFGGMRVVRAFGRVRTEAGRFVGESHLLARQELFAWRWMRSVEAVWDLILPAATSGLLLYGGFQVLRGGLTLGDLMMFLVYLAMLLEPLAVIATSVTQLQNNLAGFDRVLDVLAEPMEMADRPGALTVSKRATAGRITFEGVTFRYPGTETMVLGGVDLEVRPGETVALVGRSGAGKTTFCNLVARFYDPTSGVVRLDGVNLCDIRVESYRKLLGIVEQDVFLFDGTVAENIAYAARRASRGDVARAAAVAHADEFIEALADGYDTRIGERGVKLSGGQRQRLAIARAVLADPTIFILDEATSNLDTHSERLIQSGLSALMRDRTSFVIAHRLSTIQNADRILVMEAGRVVESGRHADLMARDGRYRDMVELQRLSMAEG